MQTTQKARPAKRRVDGIVLLDKPIGLSSNHALQRVKRIYNAQKAGHTGSLDPLASGLLPICLGAATRVGQYLLDATKTYQAEARLGWSSNTGDAEGGLEGPVPVPELGQSDWEALLATFLGDSAQIPPMYSALKHNGQRLYKLARAGQQVERAPRQVHISAISLLDQSDQHVTIEASVSSGTYIRTLIEDIALRAGTRAYTTKLRRTAIGRLNLDKAVTLEELEADDDRDQRLLPLSSAVEQLAGIQLTASEAARFVQGQRLAITTSVRSGELRVLGPDGDLLGLGRLVDGNVLSPWKVFVN